ncbi:9175_t:CDS:2, partial [Paraglomus brasilianum]
IQTIVANTELPDNQQSWDGQNSFNNSLDNLSETEVGEGVEKTLPETEISEKVFRKEDAIASESLPETET